MKTTVAPSRLATAAHSYAATAVGGGAATAVQTGAATAAVTRALTAAAAAAPAPPAGAQDPARPEEPAPCDPAPAPAPGRDRSQYMTCIVIVLCIIALALGYIFITTERPTSTPITTEGTPAQLETTTSTTTTAPEIPSRIVCFTEVDIQATDLLKNICTQVVIFVTFDDQGATNQDLTFLNTMEKSFLDKILLGMKFEENKELQFFDAVGKGAAWHSTDSHALMEVSLTDKNSQKLQNAARKLNRIQIIGLLLSSELNASMETLPLIKGLELITVTPECEADVWNETNVLVFANAINSNVEKEIALSLSAAIWKYSIPAKEATDNCSGWADSTTDIVACVNRGQRYEQCRVQGMVLVDNDNIAALVKYARSKDMNAFCIHSAERILDTLPLNRKFHLLNFTKPSRQLMPRKSKQRRSIRLRQTGAHDWASRESGWKTVTVEKSARSETEQMETEDTVVVAEHLTKSGVVKLSSKPADSATNMPVVAWRWASSNSPPAGTEQSNESPREEAKKTIKESSSPSSDMASSAPSINDEEVVLTA